MNSVAPYTGYMIEKLRANGEPSGWCFHCAKQTWVFCSTREASFPTRRAAEIYAEENGMLSRHDIEITEHQWG